MSHRPKPLNNFTRCIVMDGFWAVLLFLGVGGKVGKAGRSSLCHRSHHMSTWVASQVRAHLHVLAERKHRGNSGGVWEEGQECDLLYLSILWHEEFVCGMFQELLLGLSPRGAGCLFCLLLCPCTFFRSLPCPKGDPCGLPLARLFNGCLQCSEFSPFCSRTGRTIHLLVDFGWCPVRGSSSPVLCAPGWDAGEGRCPGSCRSPQGGDARMSRPFSHTMTGNMVYIPS